jgi:hypothetical protein
MPVVGTLKREEDWFFAWSSDFKQQSAIDVPLDNADLDILLPLTESTKPQKERNTEEIYDCDGVHIRKTYINTELLRWNFAVQPSARMFGGFMALARGGITAYSGTATNEVKTLTTDATGGYFTLSMTFEGRTGTSEPILYNDTAAVIKEKLERMIRPIEAGDITTVTGTLATSLVITFGGKLAATNLPDWTIDNTNLTGGSATVTQGTTTQGASKLLTITRQTTSPMVLTSFMLGYRGDTATFRKYYNQAVNKLVLTIEKGQISRLEIELIGSTRFTEEPTFTIPDCVNYDPIRSIDTRFEVDSNWVTGETRRAVRTLDNQMATDVEAFPFDAIYMQKFLRGRRPVESLEFSVDGCETDDIFTWAEALTNKPVNVYFGSPSNRCKDIFPKVELSEGNPPVAYAQSTGLSYLNLLGKPLKDATLGTYSKMEYYENSSTPFLGT